MPQNKITPINIDPLFTTPLNYERMLGNNLSINQPNITPRNQNAIRTAGMFLTNPKAPETATSQIKMPGLPELKPETESMPQDDSQSRFLASLLSQGAGMFGAALQGENVMKAGQVFESNRDYQNKLNEQKKQIESLTNPESDVSKRKRLVYERALGIKIPNEFSASDLEDRNVLQGLVAQSQPKPVPGRVSGGVSQPKEEKPKEKKLSQDERQLLNNSALAYKALFDMEKAIKNKVSRRSFIGDNPYTYAANRFVEGIGRMQSGGAIGTEEAENFKRLIPGPYDDDDISKDKIRDMKLELESRLKSIGYSPKEILESRTYSEEEISPSEQDQAIKWANENINSKDEEKRLKAEKILRGR